MSANPKHFYSLDEYFALEHANTTRFEYWDGDILCMSGGSLAHSRIAGNVFRRIGNDLEQSGRQCEAFTSDQPIKTPTLPPYRYPDASVVCGTVQLEQFRGIDMLINPILIVEVMSPTSAELDRHAKFEAYKEISTVREYLLIDQESPTVTLWQKQPDESWTPTLAQGLDQSIELTSLECTLNLADIYARVEFGISESSK